MSLLPPGSDLDRDMHNAMLLECCKRIIDAPDDSLDRVRYLEATLRQLVAAYGANSWEAYAALEHVQHAIRANVLRKTLN